MNKSPGYLRDELQEAYYLQRTPSFSSLEKKCINHIMMTFKALPWKTFIGYKTPSDHLHAWDSSNYMLNKTMKEIEENYKNTKIESNELVETTSCGRLSPKIRKKVTSTKMQQRRRDEKSIDEILKDSEDWPSSTEGSIHKILGQPPHPLIEYLKKGRMN